MGYKPKLDQKKDAYFVNDLSEYQISRIITAARKMGANYLLIITLALQNYSSQEIAALGFIKSNADRNRNRAVTSRTISKKVEEISKQVGIKFNTKDLIFHAQRKTRRTAERILRGRK